MPYESDIKKWSNTLNVLQQENIQLKNRLAETIKRAEENTLEEIESYLNRFISKDAAFALMRYDIAEHLRKLRGNTTHHSDMIHKHKALQRDMMKMEDEFGKLKADFNQYIAAIAV